MKFTIHPLFFLFGLYFALVGKVFLFLTFALTALVHELGHAYRAEQLGYKVNKISLMPYGAVVNCAIEGLSYKDEVSVAFAGPLLNLLLCAICACVWWLIPESYPLTDTVVFSNLSVAMINLLPAYPLDGGRILSATLSLHMKRKTAMLITKISGILISAILMGMFVFSMFTQPNPSIAFFSLFILIGSIGKTKENAYVKIFKNRSIALLSGIKQVKKMLVKSSESLRKLLIKTDGDSFFEITICFNNGKMLALDIEKSEQLLSDSRLDCPVGTIAEEISLTSPTI